MSFKENFERDESKNDVQYDDSAFYTFGGTMLICIMLPLLWNIYKRLTVKFDLYDCNLQNCECSQCLEKIENLYSKKKKNSRNFTFYLMIFCFVGLCYLSFNCYFKIKEHSDTFKTFDPFEILELPQDADDKQIKKAYKKLALKYHPDRNLNNMQAKAKFILLTKAYESLTDEISKENFRKYGNPDGPESMRLAVGLPSFVLNKKNHMPILILFLIFIVVILPGFVLYWFNSTNSYDDAGVQVTNHKIFYEILNENILLRQMPFVLGSSIEFSGITVRSDEIEELKRLYRKYSELMPKHKEEQIPMGNKKAICLVYSHLDETNNLTSESLINDLNHILEISPNLVYTMYQIARQYTALKELQEMQVRNMGIQLDQKMMIKNFGHGCIKVIIDFSAIILQKLNFKGSVLLQLPHLTEAMIKQNKTLNKISLSKDLAGFCMLSNEEKINLLNEFKLNESNVLTKSQIDDIICASNSIPNYTIKSEVKVEGFDDIIKDDYVTLKFTVVKNNLKENKVIYIFYFYFFFGLLNLILIINLEKRTHSFK
jgi:translocation protein SEC63